MGPMACGNESMCLFIKDYTHLVLCHIIFSIVCAGNFIFHHFFLLYCYKIVTVLMFMVELKLYVLRENHCLHLTLMLLVTKFFYLYKVMQKTEKCLKPWQMGTHLKVLSERSNEYQQDKAGHILFLFSVIFPEIIIYLACRQRSR